MVVVWSFEAEEDLKGVFDHYLGVAGRKTAIKIATGIRSATKRLGAMPLMASIELQFEEERKFRSLVIDRRYKAVYFVEEEVVTVVSVWDCRQDPETLKKRVKL